MSAGECGSSVCYALTEAGDAYAWGMGTCYQLTTGNPSRGVTFQELNLNIGYNDGHKTVTALSLLNYKMVKVTREGASFIREYWVIF